MDQKFLQDLALTELANRIVSEKFVPEIFAQQAQFINDPNKFKSLLASRRSGKSTTAAMYLLAEAKKHADCRVHYIALTRKSAKVILWRELKRLDKKYNLRLKFNHTDLIAELDNGSEIFLLGGNDSDSVETIRGMKSRLVIVDEAASYKSHLRYLIDEILTPMLIDHNGSLCLMGTPSAACVGPFFEATTGIDAAFSLHKWTLLDNPYIPHAASWLTNYKIKKGWTEENPIYLREWCGRWVKSLDSLVYKYQAGVNNLIQMPLGKRNHIIGVDIGYGDATAFTVGAYRDHDPTFYIIETFKKTGMIVDDIMAKLKIYIDQYNPDHIVMDSGGGGKLVAESFRKRYSIPIKPAEKKDKKDFIEQMNSDFLSGRIKVLPGNEKLTDEWELIQWDEDRKKEDSRFLNDLADSALYTWRQSYHYTEQPAEVLPEYGTLDWHHRQERAMEDAAEAEVERQRREAEQFTESEFDPFNESEFE